MKILTADNTVFDLDTVGSELAEAVHLGVFDYSNKNDYDYFFRPLIMTETFSSVTVEFQIGQNKILLPLGWSIVLGCPETGDIELIPVGDLNSRDFHAIVYNPIKAMMHKFVPLTPIDVFTEVSWTVPRLAFHNFLLMPINNNESPDCIIIINESDQKKIPPLELDIFIS